MSAQHNEVELFGLIRGELDERSAAELESHLVSCAACRAERRTLEETIDAIEEAGIVVPSDDLRERILTAALAEQVGPALIRAVPELPPEGLRDRVLAATTAPSTVVPLRSSRVRERVFAVAAVLAILVAVFSWTQSRRPDDGTPSPQIALPKGHDMQEISLEGAVSAQATLQHYKHDNFRLTLSTKGYPPTPSGSEYAVWLRGHAGDVSLGGFRLIRPDEFNVALPIAVDPKEFPRVVVTLEPIDGDPRLSGEIVSSAILKPDAIHHGHYDE